MNSNCIKKLREIVKKYFDVCEYLSRFIKLTDEISYCCPICRKKDLVIEVKSQRFTCKNCKNYGDFIALLGHIKQEPMEEVLGEILSNGNLIMKPYKTSTKKKQYYKNYNLFHS